MPLSLATLEPGADAGLLDGAGSALLAFFSFDPVLLLQPEMLGRLALQLALLFASAFFSGAETALFSLSRLDLQQLRRARHPNTATLHALLDQPRRLIISILCGNELVNIAAVANMTAVLVSLYGDERAAVISIVLMVPLLLLLGELTPQTIALSNPVRIGAGVIARPLALWVKLVTPLRWLIRGVADRVTTWLVGEERNPEHILQEDEFRSLLDEVAREGELGATERTLIHHLLDAGGKEVVDIMTPRTRLALIDGDRPVADMVARFKALRHSRVPVYRQHPDNVVGLLRLEKLLPLIADHADLERLTLDDILDTCLVVPPTKRIQEMFDYFRDHNARAALVLNEFGGVEGIVTMRDVLTFIFGHLSGEVQGQLLYEERDSNCYAVPGDMRLTDFNSLTHFGLHDTRMTTIGGVAFRHLDRLPQVGDEVEVEGFHMTVLAMEGPRIARLQVTRGEPMDSTEPSGGAD